MNRVFLFGRFNFYYHLETFSPERARQQAVLRQHEPPLKRLDINRGERKHRPAVVLLGVATVLLAGAFIYSASRQEVEKEVCILDKIDFSNNEVVGKEVLQRDRAAEATRRNRYISAALTAVVGTIATTVLALV